MFTEEACWIKQALDGLDIRPAAEVLDIGASDLYYRTVIQPHINELIHKPLLERGALVRFLDIKEHEGVDIAIDLADADLPESSFDKTFDLIICCNILEHVVDRHIFMRNLLRYAHKGTYMVVTVPRVYPKHNDPIDTMYRPAAGELTEFINSYIKCRVLTAEELVINEKEYYRYKAGRWLNRLTLLPLRMLLRWYVKPLRWRVTCILVEIQGAGT